MVTGPDKTTPHGWIILFDSIHHVLAAERVFKDRGVWCDLVPTPRDLSSDCGMAIEFRSGDVAAVRSLLADPAMKPRSFYRPSPSGYQEVTIPE